MCSGARLKCIHACICQNVCENNILSPCVWCVKCDVLRCWCLFVDRNDMERNEANQIFHGSNFSAAVLITPALSFSHSDSVLNLPFRFAPVKLVYKFVGKTAIITHTVMVMQPHGTRHTDLNLLFVRFSFSMANGVIRLGFAMLANSVWIMHRDSGKTTKSD